jgi:hypothetical protein
MVQVNSLIEGVVQDSSKPMGWFYDLTGLRGTLAEQVVINPQVNEGVVSWIGTLMNQDKCNPGGESGLCCQIWLSQDDVCPDQEQRQGADCLRDPELWPGRLQAGSLWSFDPLAGF